MHFSWCLSINLFAQNAFAFITTVQRSLQDLISADISPSTAEALDYSTSIGMPLLSRCSLDLFDLKKADYHTVFDGAYGSELTNVFLTLCSDEGKQIPWKGHSRFETSYLDQAAEQCCSDIINGFGNDSIRETELAGAPSLWKFCFISASVCCILFMVRTACKRRGE
jgi:hypothetical protein